MKKVNPERVDFIEMVLLQKSWVTYRKSNVAIKVLTLSEVSDIVKDVKTGEAVMHTDDGMYIVDGGAYTLYEYTFEG